MVGRLNVLQVFLCLYCWDSSPNFLVTLSLLRPSGVSCLALIRRPRFQEERAGWNHLLKFYCRKSLQLFSCVWISPMNAAEAPAASIKGSEGQAAFARDRELFLFASLLAATSQWPQVAIPELPLLSGLGVQWFANEGSEPNTCTPQNTSHSPAPNLPDV